MHAHGIRFGGIVDDTELVVGVLRTVTAENQGLSFVGRHHHHPWRVASGNYLRRTFIELSIDDEDARRASASGYAVGDEGAKFEAGSGSRAAGGTTPATQTHQTGRQHQYQKNQDFSQSWDSNLMPDNGLDARLWDARTRIIAKEEIAFPDAVKIARSPDAETSPLLVFSMKCHRTLSNV